MFNLLTVNMFLKRTRTTVDTENSNYQNKIFKCSSYIPTPLVIRGSPIAFNIPVLHDFMTIGKSFPGETEFEIIFTRTSDAFMFIQDKNVKNV